MTPRDYEEIGVEPPEGFDGDMPDNPVVGIMRLLQNPGMADLSPQQIHNLKSLFGGGAGAGALPGTY